MSAQNNGVARFVPIPLNSFGTAYVQGKNYSQAGGLNSGGNIAIGKTQPYSALKLNDPASAYCEVLAGTGFDFHTGVNPAGYVDYDARILVTVLPGAGGVGEAKISLIMAGVTWAFYPDGSLSLTPAGGAEDFGAAGDRLTSGGVGAPCTWAA
jgi:hypothetical protein